MRYRYLFILLASVLLLGASNAQPEAPAELAAFLDGVVEAQLEAYQIPGAVVVVVQDGEVVLAEGYGYADVDERAPVDAETTLFRIGSVTKLFTYTAIMQLVEAGEVDLDTDITQYLNDLPIPTNYDQPITVANLMTHSAGFEDVTFGLFAREVESMRPLDDLLTEQMPARIYPPGSVAAYSNHSAGMLGLLVEEISGLAWSDYVEQNILEPLEMSQTTGRQPVPEALFNDLAHGYRVVGGRYVAQPFTFVPLGPVGGMSTSGRDMANFMIAHLQGGRFGDARILEEETARQMHSQLFTHDERLGGMDHGFYETRLNGERMIGHGGGMPNFVTNLWLLPEHDLGLFVSYSSANGAHAQAVLGQAFMDRYFPNEVEQGNFAQEADDLRALTGTYRSTRIVQTGDDKLGNIAQTMFIGENGDGTLQLSGLMLLPMQLEPLEPELFQNVETGERVVITERDGTRYLFTEGTPYIAYSALPWYEAPQFHGLLLLGIALLLLSVLVAAPISLYLRRRLAERPTLLERWAQLSLLVMSVIFLAFIVSLLVGLTDFMGFTFGTPDHLLVTGGLLPVGVVLAVLAPLFALFIWVRGRWGVVARLYYSLVALAGVVFVWQLSYWNALVIP